MNEQLRLKELTNLLIALRDTINSIIENSNDSNVKWYLENSLDYYEGLAKEIIAAQNAAENE